MATIDETQEYLNRAYRLDRLIQLDADEIRRLEILASCYGATDNSERVQTNAKSIATFTNFIDKAIDKSRELEKSMIEKEEILTEVRDLIYKLEDNLEIEVMVYRYMQYLSFRTIGKKAHISKSTASKIHSDALIKLSKYL